MRPHTLVILLFFTFLASPIPPVLVAQTKATAQTPSPLNYLRPVRTESPRATLASFINAMNAYGKASKDKDFSSKQKKDNYIKRAIRTLNTEGFPDILIKQRATEAAIYIKEVIDRIAVVDYAQVPGADTGNNINENDTNLQNLSKWHFYNTEIVLERVTEGERKGAYLFSKDTVLRAHEFYRKVKHLPYLAGTGKGSHYQTPWMERILPEWALEPFLTLNPWQWLGIFIAIISGYLFRLLLKFTLGITLQILKRSHFAQYKDGLKLFKNTIKPISTIGAISVWYTSLFFLQVQGLTLAIFTVSFKLLLGIYVIRLIYQSIEHFSQHLRHVAFENAPGLEQHLAPLITRSLKMFTIVAGVLIITQNMGVNVASLLAGLGLGGLAFALAARDTVANLFGSLMIIFDRPFKIGDWIKVGDAEGNVEDIGFRSTRIRTFYNSVISIPNSEMASSQIDNMGLREYRRVVAYFNMTYETPPEDIESFIEGIKEIILAHSHTRKDYYHVVFNAYKEVSIEVMAYFFLKVPSWTQELIERQNIYLSIYRLAREKQIDLDILAQSFQLEAPK